MLQAMWGVLNKRHSHIIGCLKPGALVELRGTLLANLWTRLAGLVLLTANLRLTEGDSPAKEIQAFPAQRCSFPPFFWGLDSPDTQWVASFLHVFLFGGFPCKVNCQNNECLFSPRPLQLLGFTSTGSFLSSPRKDL